ncbi:MAG: hypothetical protein Q8N62_07130 [Candidatus Omnitrophota bacterium]|nr:hypothetical protein [Candidatus Omnitrophota bacterium]
MLIVVKLGETFLVSDGQDVSIFLALDSGKIETFPVPIRNLLGWKAPFTLEEGVRETVRKMKL